jgi:hypothetical protein
MADYGKFEANFSIYIGQMSFHIRRINFICFYIRLYIILLLYIYIYTLYLTTLAPTTTKVDFHGGRPYKK